MKLGGGGAHAPGAPLIPTPVCVCVCVCVCLVLQLKTQEQWCVYC